jgi:pimeloyl-ACP methyl ester carboxylesterase
VYLAKNRPVKGVILVSPYDSLVSIARRDFPYAPVSLLLRHRFDSVSYASSLKMPLLVLTGDKDTTIQPEYSKKFVQNWGGEHELVNIGGADHNNMSYSPLYWESITKFLKKNE